MTKKQPIINNKRKCTQCKETKKTTNFVKSKHIKSGIMAICKKCWNKKAIQRRLQNKEKYAITRRKYDKTRIGKRNKYSVEYRKRLRLSILIHYSNNPPTCSCCKENNIEFLTLDHINGGGNKHLKIIGKSRLYGWIKRNNFPSGFRVLCYNCNMSLGNYHYCPHKTAEVAIG